MDWRHEVDAGWALTRKRFLTASDIVSLIPAYKALKKKDPSFSRVLSSQFAGKIGEKCFAEVETKSFNAAARGHVLEPYAVDEFNNLAKQNLLGGVCTMFHWDDIVVSRQYDLMAFSPDAMSLPQPTTENLLVFDKRNKLLNTLNGNEGFPSPSEILEIKSYGAKHHAQCCAAKKMDLEERWQVAHAMAVCATVNAAYIMFYDPCERLVNYVPQIHVVKYNRSELASEIGTCCGIANAYAQQLELFRERTAGFDCQLKTEEDIWEETQGALSLP